MPHSSTAAPPTPAATDLIDNWFTERFTPHESHSHHFKKTIIQQRTRYQNVVLADSYSFGRCLILNGEMQSAQLDEFIYHEALVHPALVSHRHPRHILILGGGEGATLREVLRHPSIQRATMIDIDAEVVDFCRKYLRDWHHGTLALPEARIIIQDAREFILKTKETFDVIISDLPTPLEGGPVFQLYTVEFYRQVLKRLRPGGIFIAQAGSGSLVQIHFHSVLHHTLRKIFQDVRPYYAFVPSFDVPWAFLMCAQKAVLQDFTARQIDRRLGAIGRQLRFYDGEAHNGLFNIPKYLRTQLARERDILTHA